MRPDLLVTLVDALTEPVRQQARQTAGDVHHLRAELHRLRAEVAELRAKQWP